MFVPSKAFRIFLGDSCLILLKKTETLCSQKNSFFIQRSFALTLFAEDWYTNYPGLPNLVEFLELQKYSLKSDYYILFCFEKFCFLCVVCLFSWLYGFLWWVFAIEKLEDSRYNAKKNMNWFNTVLIVVVCFLILTDLTKVLLSFVWLKFSSFGLSYDGWKKDVRA